MMIIFFTSSSTQNKINRCVGRVVSTFILWLDFTKRLLLIWKGMSFVEVIFLYDCFWFACTLFSPICTLIFMFVQQQPHHYLLDMKVIKVKSGNLLPRTQSPPPKANLFLSYVVSTTVPLFTFSVQLVETFFLRCSCCLQWKGGGSGD